MRRDSVLGTFAVAAGLCVVCSLLVSAAAVGLRGLQNQNKALYQQKNILKAAGLTDESISVDERFKNIEVRIIDLATGETVPEGTFDAETFDQKAAAKSKDPARSVAIDSDSDIAGIGYREKFSRVYLLKEGDAVKKVVLPVNGKGLWSTLYGFIALENDLNTVSGLTFYEHGETPGLGGEIENPKWQAKWPGKHISDDSGKMQIEVIKGQVLPGSAKEAYQVDGLSGATITSRGVSNLIKYWLSDEAFGPFLKKLKAS